MGAKGNHLREALTVLMILEVTVATEQSMGQFAATEVGASRRSLAVSPAEPRVDRQGQQCRWIKEDSFSAG